MRGLEIVRKKQRFQNVTAVTAHFNPFGYFRRSAVVIVAEAG